MRHSEKIGALSKAMAAAQGMMSAASKDSTNPHFKSKYADLDSVISAIRGPLSEHGVAIYQGATEQEGRQGVVTMLVHGESGEWMRSERTLPESMATKGSNAAQSLGSMITYLRRYEAQSMCGIAPAEDDGEAFGKTNASAEKMKEVEGRLQAANDELQRITEWHEDEVSFRAELEVMGVALDWIAAANPKADPRKLSRKWRTSLMTKLKEGWADELIAANVPDEVAA